MKTKLLALLVFGLVFAGCRTMKPVSEVPIKTETKVIERLVPIQIPPDSAYLFALFECDSNYNVLLKAFTESKTKRMETNLTFDNGKLGYRANTNMDTVYIKGKDSIIYREVPINIPVPVEVFKLTRWEMIIQFFGYVFMICLAIIGIIALLKWKFGR